MEVVCKLCNWRPGDALHQLGCPEETYPGVQQKHSALEAWHRGWSDGLNGVGHAKDGNNSYLLGYSRGDITKRMVESGFDPNADFDEEVLDHFFGPIADQ